MLALRTFIGPVPLLSSGNAKGNKTCPLHLWSTGQESRMNSETVAQWGNCYNGRIHHVILEQGWIEILWKEEGRMAKKNKKGFNCELWNDRILKENKYFPNREGRKGILDRRNSLCKGEEGKESWKGLWGSKTREQFVWLEGELYELINKSRRENSDSDCEGPHGSC